MLLHTSNVVSKRSHVITRSGRVEAEELGKSRSVLGVLVDTKLNVLAEGSVELVKLLFVLGDLTEELENLLNNVFLDNLHNLVLLKGLTGQVKRKILGIDNTLDEAQPLRDEISCIISDEDTANIKLDVVLRLLSLEQIERSALGNEKNGTEFKLTFNREVLDSKVILPIVR